MKKTKVFLFMLSTSWVRSKILFTFFGIFCVCVCVRSLDCLNGEQMPFICSHEKNLCFPKCCFAFMWYCIASRITKNKTHEQKKKRKKKYEENSLLLFVHFLPVSIIDCNGKDFWQKRKAHIHK